MKIATVPIGYADGFIRQNAKDGYMLVNGKKQNCGQNMYGPDYD